MVHGVRLEGGRATLYRNRYVDTHAVRAGAGFGEGAPGGASNQSNVSAIWHGGRLLTQRRGRPAVRARPDDLATVGPYDFGGRLTTCVHRAPEDRPGDRPAALLRLRLRAAVPHLPRGRARRHDGALETDRSPEQRDDPRLRHHRDATRCSGTSRCVFDLEAGDASASRIRRSGAFPYQWRPEAGARIGVMPLAGGADRRCSGSTSTRATCSTASTPSVAATRSSSTCAACATMFVDGRGARRRRLAAAVDGRHRDRRRSRDDVLDDATDRRPAVARPAPRRPRAPLRLPRRDPRQRRHRRLRRRHQARHRHRPTRASGTRARPRTAASGCSSPSTRGEDDGATCSAYVHDEATDRSELVVIDATDVTDGPVAQVELPARVPYGFHAAWVPAVVGRELRPGAGLRPETRPSPATPAGTMVEQRQRG